MEDNATSNVSAVTGPSDEVLRRRDTYGASLVRLLHDANHPELASFIHGSSETYKLAIARKFKSPSNDMVASIRADRVSAMVDSDVALAEPLEEDFSKYSVWARLIYIGVVEREYLARECTLADWLRLGPKIASAVCLKSMLSEVVDLRKAKVDFDMLVSVNADPTLVTISLGVKIEAVTYTISNLYWHQFRNIRGWDYRDGCLWDGDYSFRVEPDPIFGGPGLITDAAEFARHLALKQKSNVNVVIGSWAHHHLVSYILAQIDVTYDKGKISKVVNKNSLAHGGRTYFSGLRWTTGLRLIEMFSKWALDEKFRLPTNLMSNEWTPAMIHYALDWGMNNYAEEFNASFGDNFLEKITDWIMDDCKTEIVEGMGPWRKYEDPTEIAMDVKKTNAVFKGVGATCKDLMERRTVENTNPNYNRMFETADASPCGFEDSTAADFAKHRVLMGDLMSVAAGGEHSSIDIFGIAGGAPAIVATELSPGIIIKTFHATASKKSRYDFQTWVHTDGYKRYGSLIYDISYGAGTSIEAANSMKVERLLDAKYDGGVVKFTLVHTSKIGMVGGVHALPWSIEKLCTRYKTVEIRCPGKLHSPEIFVFFHGLKVDPTALIASADDIKALVAVLSCKAIAMMAANNLRVLLWEHGMPVAFGPGTANVLGKALRACLVRIGYRRNFVETIYDIGDVSYISPKKKAAAVDDADAMADVLNELKNAAESTARMSAMKIADDVLAAGDVFSDAAPQRDTMEDEEEEGSATDRSKKRVRTDDSPKRA